MRSYYIARAGDLRSLEPVAKLATVQTRAERRRVSASSLAAGQQSIEDDMGQIRRPMIDAAAQSAAEPGDLWGIPGRRRIVVPDPVPAEPVSGSGFPPSWPGPKMPRDFPPYDGFPNDGPIFSPAPTVEPLPITADDLRPPVFRSQPIGPDVPRMPRMLPNPEPLPDVGRGDWRIGAARAGAAQPNDMASAIAAIVRLLNQRQRGKRF